MRRESPLLRYTSALPPRSRMPAPTITVLQGNTKHTLPVLSIAHDQQIMSTRATPLPCCC